VETLLLDQSKLVLVVVTVVVKEKLEVQAVLEAVVQTGKGLVLELLVKVMLVVLLLVLLEAVEAAAKVALVKLVEQMEHKKVAMAAPV
jgi:hypothetical protein